MGKLDKMPSGEKLSTKCPHCSGGGRKHGETCKPCNGTGKTKQQ